jgi:uncharacterized protein involved in response to NO
MKLSKSLFKSKSFWIAVAQAVGGAVGITVSADTSVHAISAGAIAKSVLDVVIRMNTDKPVHVIDPEG